MLQGFRLDISLPPLEPKEEGTVQLAGYLMLTRDGTLGSGGLGTVRLGRHVGSGKDVAIKIGNDFDEKEGCDGQAAGQCLLLLPQAQHLPAASLPYCQCLPLKAPCLLPLA